MKYHPEYGFSIYGVHENTGQKEAMLFSNLARAWRAREHDEQVDCPRRQSYDSCLRVSRAGHCERKGTIMKCTKEIVLTGLDGDSTTPLEILANTMI
jgi:hypothetical protein